MNSLYITLPAALIPSAILIIYIYRKDLNREPMGVVLVTFILGLIIPVPLAIYHHLFHPFIPTVQNPYLSGFVVSLFRAAIPEELCKFLLLFLFCIRMAAFDEEMDGLVYGAVASLGFATIENVLYVSKYGFGTAVVRAITAVPAHASFGIMMGYFLVKWKSTRRTGFLLKALLVPIALHTVYNFPLSSMRNVMQSGGISYNLVTVFSLLFLVCVMAAFLNAIKIVNLMSRRQQNAAIIANVYSEIQNEISVRQNSSPDLQDGNPPEAAMTAGRSSLPDSGALAGLPPPLDGEPEPRIANPDSSSGGGIVSMLIMGCFVFFFLAFLMQPGRDAKERRPAESRATPAAPKIVQNRDAIADAGKQKNADPRFTANGDGTVTDKNTGLMWAAADNGKYVDWQNAKQHCESYRGGGYRGWRMPTRNELAGLYGSAFKGYELQCLYTGIVKVPDQVTLSCFYLWSSDEEGPNASITDLRDGKQYWIDKKGGYFRNFRVLPVRTDG